MVALCKCYMSMCYLCILLYFFFPLHDDIVDSYLPIVSMYVYDLLFERTLLEKMVPLEHPWIIGAQRIPVLAIIELEYYDNRGWQVDPSIFMTVYTGPVYVYIRYGDASRAYFMGTFRIIQCMPFN